MPSQKKILEVKNLKKYFPTTQKQQLMCHLIFTKVRLWELLVNPDVGKQPAEKPVLECIR